MKTKSTRTQHKALLALSLTGGLLMGQQLYAAANPFVNFSISNNFEDEVPAKKKKKTSKAFSARNNSSVKIYPDILKREMHVMAKYNEGKEIDFFVFDLSGTLMHNFKMKSKEHTKITGLDKGVYVYRVFSGDEETASGKFEIK